MYFATVSRYMVYRTVIIIFVLLFVAFAIYHNRAHPKVIETLITFFAGVIIVFSLIFQPEKHEIKFPFVYFYDWEKGRQIDLTTPGHYFIENNLLPLCEDILKNRLNHCCPAR